MGDFVNYTPNQFGNVTVLLLDAMDTNWKQWKLGWPQVVRFIQKLNPNDHLAVYSLDEVHGLQIIQDYPDSISGLIQKLQHLQNLTLPMLLPSPQSDEQFSRSRSFAQRNSKLETPELLSLGRIQGIAAALKVIADHMARVPGRKSLIWLASSFPNPFPSTHKPVLESYRSKMLEAVNRLISENVAIYPIDATGLTTDPSFDVQNDDIGIHPLEAGEAPNLPFSHDVSSALELAKSSGGKAFLNTNALTKAMQEIVLTEQSSYTLGFYALGEPDNQYHSLKVTVMRSGIHLRYRPGYWDLAVPPIETSEDDLKRTLESPFTVAAIHLQARALSRSHLPRNLQIEVFIDSRDLALRREQGAWSTTLDILFGQKDLAGKVFAVPPYRIPVSMTAAGLASNDWFTTKTTLALLARSEIVRIVVRDENSGNIGSLDIPLEKLR